MQLRGARRGLSAGRLMTAGDRDERPGPACVRPDPPCRDRSVSWGRPVQLQAVSLYGAGSPVSLHGPTGLALVQRFRPGNNLRRRMDMARRELG